MIDIQIIKPYIQRAALIAYMNKCESIYTIAFFQWRIMYPGYLRFDREELEELI